MFVICYFNGLLHPILRHSSKFVSECWMVYAVLTAWVIFTTKTGLDAFSLRQEQV